MITSAVIASIVAAVLLAMLGYLIRGLLAWGRVTGSLEERMVGMSDRIDGLTTKTQTTATSVEEIKTAMLRPADLELAVAKLRIEVMRETFGRRAADNP